MNNKAILKKISKKFPVLIIIFSIFCAAVFQNRITGVFSPEKSIALPIIMYHSVLKDPARSAKYIITPQRFEEDLLYLKQKGYTPVSVNRLIRYVYGSGTLPEKPVLLTFDDGMYNNLEYILPILEKYNACAVFSVVGSYTDEYSKSNITNSAYSYLRWCDIKAASETGHIEFGNHSYNFHSISSSRHGSKKNKYENSLDYINIFYQDTEKTQSEFYSNCGFKPIIYTYPFGIYSTESSRVLKKMGFLVSFSCEEGINKITHDGECLFLLRRYNRDGRLSSYEFFSKLKI